MNKKLSAAALSLAVWPRQALACAVCFGGKDNAPLIRALTWGGALLLGSTFFLVGGIVAALVRIERSRAAQEARRPAA